MDKREIDFSWDFTTSNTKEYTHCYHSYPAMMIPQIARRIIKEYLPKKSSLIFDPYLGSGTSLVEARLNHLNSIGTDLNPLARLISESKSNIFNVETIIKDFNKIKQNILNYNKSIILDKPIFKNIDFWFREDIINEISFLKNIIETNIDNENYNFFVIPLSETIREVSYTRNSEFKLYRIAKDKLDKHNVDTFAIFCKKVERNIKGLNDFNEIVNKDNYAKVYDFNTCLEIPSNIFNDEVDMVLTSPPYGDSKTTVAYGQFSRLSNQWLGINDAEKVDNNLMGGKSIKSDNKVLWLNSIKGALNNIKNIDEKRYFEVVSFMNDYVDSITNVSSIVKKNGIVVYVVGNRMVKSNQIELDLATAEIFEENGFSHIKTIIRNIPNKKMPKVNSPTNEIGKLQTTMNSEYIVILKKN
jgi:tRNA G10  N-methylase Trm11